MVCLCVCVGWCRIQVSVFFISHYSLLLCVCVIVSHHSLCVNISHHSLCVNISHYSLYGSDFKASGVL